MKAIMKIHILLVVGLSFSAVCVAVENPNVSTSFQSNTNVPSQGQNQRLLTRPNPLAASGNDVVTGNVGGLRYFHGVVPYGSSYYNSANLGDSGSNDINLFLRQSTDPILSDRNPGQTRAFYEPQRAVSSFYVQNGQKTPLSSAITQSQRNPYALPGQPQTMLAESPPRPLSTNNLELEQILSRQVQLKEAAKEKLIEDKSKFKDFFETVLKPEEPEKNEQELKPEEEQKIPVKPEIEILNKSKEEQEKLNLEQEATAKESQKETNENTPAEGEPAKPDEAALHAQAKHILGEHETYAGLAEAKFSDYMRAAEEFIREGMFYKAADAYALAAVWKSDDVRPYAGQAFALFAAGEYMSSAYYLSRAIEMNPALAAKKYDLPGLIGDRDIFENRLIEMTTWQERSGSGELAFLMAYILYQDGKVSKAADAIGKAEEKMPDSAAVAILKNVIIPENKNKTSP